jgi:TRAP-type mannitol/chloroaromatic compound transport system permease large subunit
MGLLSLPTMLKNGYDPRLATGVISASGTLGQIIPPSIVLVILGDQLQSAYQKAQLELGNFSPDTVSVGDLFAGALIPGLVLVGLYILYVIAVAIFRPRAAPAMPVAEGQQPSAVQVLHALVPPVALIVAVLGSILAGIATPTEAAAVGAVGALLLAGHRMDENRPIPIYVAVVSLVGVLVLTAYVDLRVARASIPVGDAVGTVVAFLLCLGAFYGIAVSLIRVFRREVLVPVMRSTTQITSMVFVILIGAAFFSLVFRDLGGEELVEEALSGLPGGTLGAIIGVMLIMFVLGFFLDFLEIVFVVVPLVAPVLLKLEMPDGGTMSPVWLGIMMAMNLQTSFLTPPFGFALFYLRGVAPPSVRTMDIYRGIVPFVAIQLLALVILWEFPALATWLPTAIYGR